jgi:mevalonate pyrophosphate decarboxylase
MKDLGALVSAASKKNSAKKKRKNVQSLEHLVAGSGLGSTSGPVVDLEGEEPSEELWQDSAKRQKVRVPSEDPITPIRAVPVRSERGDFLQLPKVWSEPELCGPQSTLFLDDPELKIIQNLGLASRSKAITDGVMATMKALEVAAALNNASLESEVRVDALVRKRDALTAIVAAL